MKTKIRITLKKVITDEKIKLLDGYISIFDGVKTGDNTWEVESDLSANGLGSKVTSYFNVKDFELGDEVSFEGTHPDDHTTYQEIRSIQ